ncbi:MAG: FG-GAP-like repeat-containing protein [Acidobacteriia bacterium]|nr:FG-GAP-like repeat-containing protein [Terriglobia bacterium]
MTRCSPGTRAAADFNRDGLLDMAEVDLPSQSLNIYLGTSAGSISLSHTYAVGQNPFTVVAGDFNGDSKIDLAVVNFGPMDGGDGTLSVLLGNGDGTFQSAVSYNLGFNPTSAVVGDFNGDGKLDLVAVNNGDGGGGSLSILIGKGDGTFQTPVNFHVNAFPQSIALGDLNGDGKLDLAVGTMNFDGSGGLAIFLGNGDGTFHNPVIFSAGDSPEHVAVADLNGDANLDIVVVNKFSNNVQVFLGNGNGTIQPPIAYAVGQQPSFVGIQDLNGDGKLDLILLNLSNLNFSILFGNGDGTFIGPRYFPTGTDATIVKSADLRTDGSVDLLIANQHDNSVTTLLGNSDGTFGNPFATPFKISVLVSSPSATPSSEAIGDFNGDGKPDVAVAELDGGAVSILLGAGDGTLLNPANFTAGRNPMSVSVGDFNGDGKADLAVANYGDLPTHGSTPGSVSILLGNGDGTFQSAVSSAAGTHPQSVVVGDFNQDGKLDLAVVDNGVSGADPGGVKILLGNGDGTFQTPSSLAVGTNPNALALGDFNGDGKADLAVTTLGPGGSSKIAILLGNGNGTFQSPVMYATDSGPQWLAVGDLNADGKSDLVVAHCCGSQDTTYLLNNGDGTFAPEVHLTAGGSSLSLVLTDFSGDGKPDLALGGSGDFNNGVSVLLNQNSSTCPKISLTPGTLSGGPIGTSLNQTLVAHGGSGSYSFALTFGVLPSGVTLSSSGVLSGTSTTGGVFLITVTATDTNSCRGSQDYSLTIRFITGASTKNETVSNGGANALSTIGIGSSVKAGDATVTVNSGSPPYGTAVFSFSVNGVVQSEAGVPSSPPTTDAKIFIDFRSGVSGKTDQEDSGTLSIDTGLAVVNPNGTTAHVTYTLRDVNAQNPIQGTGTIAPHAHVAKFIDQLSDLAPNFVLPANFSTATQFGTLEISSDQPLSILALRITANQRGDSLLTSTTIADLTKSLNNSIVYFPQLADGGGFKTAIVLLNTSGSTETGVLQIRGDSGAPLAVKQQGGSGVAASSFAYNIPAGGAFIFSTDGSPVNISAGSVQVVPDPGTMSPVGAGLFSLKQAGIEVTESGIASATPTTHARIYVDKSGGHDTGLAIANPGASPINVAAGAFQLDGTTGVGSSLGPIALNGNGHTAAFVGQLISGLPAGFTGVLDISSSSPFVALTLRALTNTRGDTLLTTFPIADFNQTAPVPIIFPQIADGGGFQTQFIFLSGGVGASNFTLNFFGDDGSPLGVGKKAY